MPKNEKQNIVIAGAGLVGPLLSIFLRRRGYDVSLYERHSSLGKENSISAQGRSINLVITSRGLYALERAGLLKETLPLTVPVRGRMLHSLNGELNFQPYGRNDNECNYSVSRAGLNQFLLQKAAAAGVKIFFDSELTAVDFANRNCRFKGSNQKIAYDVFFAADGAGSVARAALAACGAAEAHTEWLDTDYKELVIPSEFGRKLDGRALHIWPRGTHMMMALPNVGGDQTVTLYLPRGGRQFSFEKLGTQNGVREFFQSQFRDAVNLMPNYLNDFFSHPQGRLGTVRTSKWIYNDSFCLIGDAAHAIVPFFGQGMNLGFEDCTALIDTLDKTRIESDRWGEALAAFNSERIKNANAIADMALDNFVEMRDRVGQADFLLKKKLETQLEARFPDLYRSRYGMITYTLIPYALAQRAGEIQSELLDELIRTSPASDLDIQSARELIDKKLTPFYREHGINTQRYTFQ